MTTVVHIRFGRCYADEMIQKCLRCAEGGGCVVHAGEVSACDQGGGDGIKLKLKCKIKILSDDHILKYAFNSQYLMFGNSNKE